MLVRIAPLRIALAAALLSLPLSAQVATWEVSTSPNPSYPATPSSSS